MTILFQQKSADHFNRIFSLRRSFIGLSRKFH